MWVDERLNRHRDGPRRRRTGEGPMTALLLALLLALPSADSGHRVHDFANVLSAAQRQELEDLSRDVDRAVGRYPAETTHAARRLAFEGVLGVASQSPTPVIDPNDLVGRRAADEYTGALNRRQIALRAYEDAVAARESLARSTRGKIGLEFAAE